jgi:branched-chain amino acid transport system permease protein
MLGGLIVGVVSELVGAVSDPSYKDVVAFLILILFLLLRPRGLFGSVTSARRLMA